MKTSEQQNWFNALVGLIEIFSDKGFQNEVWIKGKEFYLGKGPCLHWYEDAIGDYFDSYNMSDFSEMIEKNFITKEEFEIIKPFHIALDTYSENKTNRFTEEDLISPEWTEVTQLAKKAVDDLKINNRK